MNFFLALDYGLEGWMLTHYDSLSDVVSAIMNGKTYGYKFKILKELEIAIEEQPKISNN